MDCSYILTALVRFCLLVCIGTPEPSRVPAGCDDYLFTDRKSTRLNSSHANISYAVFCLKKQDVNYIYELQKHGQQDNLKALGCVTDHGARAGITQGLSDILFFFFIITRPPPTSPLPPTTPPWG